MVIQISLIANDTVASAKKIGSHLLGGRFASTARDCYHLSSRLPANIPTQQLQRSNRVRNNDHDRFARSTRRRKSERLAHNSTTRSPANGFINKVVTIKTVSLYGKKQIATRRRPSVDGYRINWYL